MFFVISFNEVQRQWSVYVLFRYTFMQLSKISMSKRKVGILATGTPLVPPVKFVSKILCFCFLLSLWMLFLFLVKSLDVVKIHVVEVKLNQVLCKQYAVVVIALLGL